MEWEVSSSAHHEILGTIRRLVLHHWSYDIQPVQIRQHVLHLTKHSWGDWGGIRCSCVRNCALCHCRSLRWGRCIVGVRMWGSVRHGHLCRACSPSTLLNVGTIHRPNNGRSFHEMVVGNGADGDDVARVDNTGVWRYSEGTRAVLLNINAKQHASI